MFEKFTDRARRVIVQAQEESRTLRYNYVGPEHILLALMRDDRGAAVHLLTDRGITEDRVRDQLGLTVQAGLVPPTGHIPFTPGPRRPWNCRCGKHCSSATRTSVPSTCCSA